MPSHFAEPVVVAGSLNAEAGAEHRLSEFVSEVLVDVHAGATLIVDLGVVHGCG